MTQATRTGTKRRWPWLLALLLAATVAVAIWWLFLRTDIIYRGPPIPVGAGTVEERELVLMESAAGEDQLDFLRRVGRVLADHSDRTSHEACGQVCQNRDSSRFAVQVVTNDAHIMCAMWTTCPEGYIPTGANIHSHCPAKRVLRANAADMAMSANRYKLGDRLKPCVDDRFSAMDFDAGPGYLATQRRLLYQEGRKQLADLGPLAPDTGRALSDARDAAR